MPQTMTSTRYRALVGLLAGVVGGLIFTLLLPQSNLIFNLLWGALLGGLFGLLVGERVDSSGTALVWAEALSLFWWLLAPVTLFPLFSGEGFFWHIEAIRTLTPDLLGYLLGYGTGLGLAYSLFLRILPRVLPMPASLAQQMAQMSEAPRHSIVSSQTQAALVSTLGGLLGAWFLVQMIYQAGFFAELAALVGSSSPLVGQMLYYLAGAIFGLLFGLPFHPHLQRVGPTLIWGVYYGLFWWILNSLILIPWLQSGGLPADGVWNVPLSGLNSLTAYIFYGIILSLFYIIVNKIWHFFFIDSDPLNRSQEGIGIRGVRSVLMGTGAGIIGGLFITVVMLFVGAYPRLAVLLGAESEFSGLLTYLLISILIGLLYGLLFQQDATNLGSGIAWGLVYGIFWWYLGTNNLFDILLNQEIDWSQAALIARYPSLVSFLLYGLGVGICFTLLNRRYNKQYQPTESTSAPSHDHTTVPALWALVFALTVMLPILITS